jgi:hypothetical protein
MPVKEQSQAYKYVRNIFVSIHVQTEQPVAKPDNRRRGNPG